MPASLVCKHIESSVSVFQTAMLRILNGLGSRNEGFHVGVVATAKKLGGLLARKIVLKVIPHLGRSSLAREALSTLIVLMLRTSNTPSGYGSVARDIRQGAMAVRKDATPPPEEALRYLFETISEFSQLLRLDDANTMLLAVREISETDPTQIYWAVEFVARVLPAAAHVFPWMIDASKVRSLSPTEQKSLNRYFAPLHCAVIATLRNNEYTKDLAADVRAGNTQRIITDMQQMKDLADQVGHTISLEGVTHE
ncbi:MAG: hypothetical protein WB681_04925 [Candidatus Cybelea sp.]